MAEDEKKEQSYRDHIQDLLRKVTNDEKVFEDPKPSVEEKIEKYGLSNCIREVFNESFEEEYEELEKKTSESEQEEVETTEDSFEDVVSKSQAMDAFPVWERAKQLLRRIGKDEADELTFVKRKVLSSRDDDPVSITARLVKHKEHQNRPYMQVSFDEDDDSTPAELALPYIEGVGIKVLENTIYETPRGNFVYFEFDA
jgi:hypothetical protein